MALAERSIIFTFGQELVFGMTWKMEDTWLGI
jgi:hypothetical protein